VVIIKDKRELGGLVDFQFYNNCAAQYFAQRSYLMTEVTIDAFRYFVVYSTLPIPPGGGKNFRQFAVWEEEERMENDNSLRRLKTIEGHLRGIIRMVEEDAYCIDVIRQIQAVEAARNKDSSQILEGHLNSCVITAVQGSDKKERERVLKEITEVFEMANKV
jgi:DNA-binding FrmR family transcriptional regulator